MKEITKEMLRIYEPVSKLDWMNYKLVKSKLTYHHIIKREHRGLMTIENGALLMPKSHEYLHIIEYKDRDLYKGINDIFMMVNDQGYEPDLNQRQTIEYLLQYFEYNHKHDRNSKNKILIKPEYKNRW